MTAFSAPPRRFLYLWFDRLPTDRLRRTRLKGRKPSTRPRQPLALIVRQGNAVRLHALTAAAQAAGLAVGMSLSDAKAQIPDLKTFEADPASDLAFLDRLAEACRRYTPALAVAAPDGLYLNITGTDRLFGGEDGLVADVSERLAAQGLSFRHGLADTPGLAWGLARFGRVQVAAPGVRGEALRDLPMAALQLPDATCSVLKGLGLRHIGQLLDRPRAPLAKRIGTDALDRLDEALGVRASALSLKLEIPPYYAEARLAEPIAAEDQVLQVAHDLAAQLTARLENEGRGGRLFRLELFRLDGAVKTLEVGASRPIVAPSRIAALFIERLAALNEGLEADFGFEQARLWALTHQPLKAAGQDLLQESPSEEAFAALADRLSARMGAGAVKRLAPVNETRLPERAVRTEPFEANAPPVWAEEPPAVDEGTLLRPVTLFVPPHTIQAMAGVPEDPPQQFIWRRLPRRIVAAEGPERLEPEWGRASTSRVRDYYRLEDDQGRRYWVFREGRFGDKDPVRWFLHGLFA